MRPDDAIARSAARQHGAFSLGQAAASGLTRAMRRSRVERGLWVVRLPRTFAIAGAPHTWEQDVITATLAFEGSRASHTTAGTLLGIAEGPAIHLTLPRGQHRRARTGIFFHEAELTKSETRVVRGIPVTAPNRTIVDIASVGTDRVLEAALDDAIQQGLTTVPTLRRYIEKRGLLHNRGVARLTLLLADRERAVVHKELERMMRRKLKAAKIVEDRRQYPIGPYFVDFAWLDRRVVVELDGIGGHFSAEDFRYRIKRDRHIHQAGFTPYHYCWDEVDTGWDEVERELRLALGLRS